MHYKKLKSLMRTLATASVVALCFTTSAAYQEDGPSRNLGQTIFVYGDPAADRDSDGLRDSLEFELANSFKPKLIFDRDEKARGPAEPKVLFQVRPAGCIGNGCSTPWKVWIGYSFLFAEDGGYGPESPCKFGHKGDNDRLRILTESRDGQNWKVVEIRNAANTQFVWPDNQATFEDGHVRIYMSAHKHHQYFDTTRNHKTTAYASEPVNSVSGAGIGCDEDVAGDGQPVTPSLVSTYSDRRYNNVGEPDSHGCSYFVDDLAPLGFIGQYAWGGEFYDSGTAMRDVWMYHPFSFGRLFCIYTPPGVPRTLKRATITLLTVKRLDGSSDAPTSFVFVANDQRHPVSATTSNIKLGSTVSMKKNSTVVDGLPECERLQLRIEAFNAGELIAKFGNTFDANTNFGSGDRTAILTTRADDPLSNREKKMFEVTYRINVLTIREHGSSIPK